MITVIVVLVQKCIFSPLVGFRVHFFGKKLQIKYLRWKMDRDAIFSWGLAMQSGIIDPERGCEKNF